MSPLRIIAGQARGRILRLPPETARPTTQKVRGAVFSMLEAQLWRLGEGGWAEVRVLDLFAGSGAYGIEALSRGAAWADFVEQDPRTRRIIRENLSRAGFVDRARVYTSDVLAFLQRRALGPLPYAIIFADPPYGYPRLGQVLTELAARGPASGVGLVVVETGRQDTLPVEIDGLTLLRRRVHGDTAITLYLWRQREAAQQPADLDTSVQVARAPGGRRDSERTKGRRNSLATLRHSHVGAMVDPAVRSARWQASG